MLEQVLENLGRSLEASPRTIWLIYNTPVHDDVVRASSLFTHGAHYGIGGNRFRVYANRSPGRGLARAAGPE